MLSVHRLCKSGVKAKVQPVFMTLWFYTGALPGHEPWVQNGRLNTFCATVLRTVTHSIIPVDHLSELFIPTLHRPYNYNNYSVN